MSQLTEDELWQIDDPGAIISAARLAGGLSIADVAKRAKVSETSLSRMEKGEIPIPLDDVLSLAAVLKIDGRKLWEKMRDFTPGQKSGTRGI